MRRHEHAHTLVQVGIDEDKDGCISMSDFLEFCRRTIVADLPASKVGHTPPALFLRAAPPPMTPSAEPERR